MTKNKIKIISHRLNDKFKNLLNNFSEFFGRKYYIKLRKDFKEKRFTILSNNCVGGVIYHQIGCPFDSPLINTKLVEADFFKFVNNLKEYIDGELIEIDSNLSYPVAQLTAKDLDPITIYFVHYKNFEVAKKKWNERIKRIDFDNIFIVFDTCQIKTEERVLYYYGMFEKCEYKNKIQLTRFDLKKPNLKQINITKFRDSTNFIIQREKHSLCKRFIDQLNYKRFFLDKNS